MYHKVAPDAPTRWWVEADTFYRQMCELKAYEVVSLEDYDPANEKQAVITFDGIYKNVLDYAAPILAHFDYPFELFLSSDHIGQVNDFDPIEPKAAFATADELKKLVSFGGRLQWHTRSHARLPGIADADVLKTELTVPEEVKALDPRGFKWIAYPHGLYDVRVQALAAGHFSGALSCEQGQNGDRFAWPRLTATNSSSFRRASIGVIIPCYNYGHFLAEAVESVLRQTRPADAILITDDASTDDSAEVGRYYADKYPGLIRFNRNAENLGIVKNFNQAVNQIGTDYVCLLGADNRFRSDCLERCSTLLDSNPQVGVAYTDFALFGPRAAVDFELFGREYRGEVLENTYYLVHFPDFEKVSREDLEKRNIMHGSSMYRRRAFEEVGGYLETSQAEDHNLFRRIVLKGWQARRVAYPVLEYRKHSSEQSNARFVTQAQLNFYKDLVRHKNEKIAELEALLLQQRPVALLIRRIMRLPFLIVGALIPKKTKAYLKQQTRAFLVSCEKCEQPVFKLRRFIPEKFRRSAGTLIWRIQKQYFP